MQLPMIPETISCEVLISFLDDYVEGRLAAAELERFERHLARCPSCVAYLQSYRETVRLARGASLDPGDGGDVPEELVVAVLDALRR